MMTNLRAPAKKRRDNTSKKKLARRKKEKKRTVTRSVTDPDSGLFVKGDHKRQFAYEAHTACDKHGFVLETVVTPGNVHDSVAFDEVYDKVTKTFPETETIVADSAYKTPHICKKVFDDGRVLSTAYKRPQTMKGGHEWWKYVYDEYYDCVLCPEYQVLDLRTPQTGTATGNTEATHEALCRAVPPEQLMHPLQRQRQNRTAAYLERLRGLGRRRPLYAKIPEAIQAAKRNH